jgi:hypothetical protein
VTDDVPWHFSEDPTITRFEPHVPATNPEMPPMVWAIDDEHAPAYWFPRQCPRITFWSADGSPPSALGPTASHRVHAVEAGWLGAMHTTVLYAYRFDPSTFEPWDSADGHLVSRVAVEPMSVDPVGDLVARHADEGIELRLVRDLRPLRDAVIDSGYRFSMIRLRNAGL